MSHFTSLANLVLIVPEHNKLPCQSRQIRLVLILVGIDLSDVFYHLIEIAPHPILLVGFLACAIQGTSYVQKAKFDQRFKGRFANGVEIGTVSRTQPDTIFMGILNNLGQLGIEKNLSLEWYGMTCIVFDIELCETEAIRSELH